jgi:hypothetical protein
LAVQRPSTLSLNKGIFRINGSELTRLSISQVNELAEKLVVKKGCGQEGCERTLKDAFYEWCEGQIMCYICRNHKMVDMREACDKHPDTKLVYLIINALAKVAEYYHTSAKKLTHKSRTLPHTNLLNHLPTIPCTQGLSLHPWVMSRNNNILIGLLDGPFLTQFAELVKLLNFLARHKTYSTAILHYCE